jgi:hypothetical protein
MAVALTGSWLLFLDVLTYLSIASNLGVVMFTDRTFLSGYDTEVKLGVFLAVEVWSSSNILEGKTR